MWVSIAIVNWNTNELLHACLRSLFTSSNLPAQVEVIVVDNGSIDGSADMVARFFPTVKLIRNRSNVGFTRAVNQAYAISIGQFFLLFNSDAELRGNAIAQCAHYLDNHADVAVLGCRLENPDGSTQSSCFRFTTLSGLFLTSIYISQIFRNSYYLNWDRYGCKEWSEPHEVDCVMGSFMMIDKKFIKDEELLDAGYFMYGEEKDLCFRLHREGLKTIYFPDATVVHHHFGSSGDPKIAAWVYEMKRRAKLRFIYKWRGTLAGWFANLIMIFDLLPRSIAWAFGDAATALRKRGSVPERLLKLRAWRFHLAALFSPSLLDSNWGPDK